MGVLLLQMCSTVYASEIFVITPSEIATNIGTLDDGNLVSVSFLDGDTYDVSELTGSPAFQIDMNFTTTTPAEQVTIHAEYDGNLGHVVNVDIFNFTGSTWDTLGQIPDNGGIIEYNFTITGTLSDYLSTNITCIRIEHVTSGSTQHDIYIDWAYITGEYDQDTTATGSFTHDTDNDAPLFASWYDSTTLIDPDADVLFYVVIYDIDNSSTELNVTLYWSDDSFGAINRSHNMAFSNSPSTNNYRYTYLFPGKPLGTYYQYYYVVNDGANTVYQPAAYLSGIYFDIQWDAPYVPSGGPAPIGTTTTEDTSVPLAVDGVGNFIIVISTPLVFGGVLLILGIYIYKKKQEEIRY